MSSPIVFALTREQARLLATWQRSKSNPSSQRRCLESLEHRYLIERTRRGWRQTPLGLVAAELCRLGCFHEEHQP